MRKLILFITVAMIALCANAQKKVFTLVYATSDDGFVNVRSSMSTKAPVVDKVIAMYHGISSSVLVSEHGKWVKVRGINGKVGYAVKRYLDYISWYSGSGKNKLVAKKPKTMIYVENAADDTPSYVPFMTVSAATIIADEYSGPQKGYYCIQTGHDNLYVKASDVNVVKK